MRIRKFVAGDVREALTKIKEELGPDAMVVATRAHAGFRQSDVWNGRTARCACSSRVRSRNPCAVHSASCA